MAILPRLKEDIRQLVSPSCMFRDLEELTRGLRATLSRIDDTWRHRDVTYDDDDPPTFPSLALAAYKSSPLNPWNLVKAEVRWWQESLGGVKHTCVHLARNATKFWNSRWGVDGEEGDRASAATARASDLQEEVARCKMARENRVRHGRALGREEGAEVMSKEEARVRREARVAASEATWATKMKQQVEEALWLLEDLDTCDEAPVITSELQRRLRDIYAALEETNEVSLDVPEALVAKVAEAKRLWEANARLAKGHLDDIEFHVDGAPDSPSPCEVAERCQRATENIPRLLQPPECPQGVPKVSPVTTEPQEVSPPRLQALVAVVATLGVVVTTVTGPLRAKCLHESPDSLQEDLKNFTRSLCKILDHGNVTARHNSSVPSLGRALATLRATPGTTWANVRATASAWRESVAKLVDSWDWLAREATKLHEKVVMAQQLMVALDMEEVAREMVTHDAQVAAATSEAMGEAVAATRLGMAVIRRGHWAEVALEPLQRLVATCDRATLFYWIMECQLRDIEAILKCTNEAFPDVLQVLVAQVAQFERLWVASARLAKDHLLGILGDIDNILLSPCGGPGGPGSHAVAEQCQKAIEDIPRLLWGQ